MAFCWLQRLLLTAAASCSLGNALSSTSTVRRFYAAFNNAVDARLPPTFDRPVDNEADLPLVDFEDLMTTPNCCCVVCLTDRNDASVLDRMWEIMETIFANRLLDEELAEDDDNNNVFHRQTLTRNDQDDTKRGGYDYIHYPPVNESNVEELRNLVGESGVQQVDNAFRLVAQVGRCYSASIYAQSTAAAAAASDNVLSAHDALHIFSNLLDDDDDVVDHPDKNSGSFQRLARYYYNPASSDDTVPKQQKESIRAHCDWSFATLVPVSAVTGLEIYNGRAWVRPEHVARRHYEETMIHRRRDDPNIRWQSHYVVVLVGKWLETLTKGAVESTIHRVVSCHDRQPARLSAPLFLRPTMQVSEAAEGLALLANNDEIDIDAAQAQLSEFLSSYNGGD